jgi:type II secretory pathway component PulF
MSRETTKETVSEFLSALAADVRAGKPIASAIDELADEMDKWEEALGEATDEDDRLIDEMCL